MRYMMPIVVLLFLIACMGSPTEPLAAATTPTPTHAPVATSVPTTVTPRPPHFSIEGGCDPWGPWTPKWVVTNSGGPAWDNWIDYYVFRVGEDTSPMAQYIVFHSTFHMDANSSTNVGSFLYDWSNPYYTLRIVYKPTGQDISYTVNCSAGIPKPTPVGTPYPTPTPVPTPTPTPRPGTTPTPCPPGPGGGCQ